MVLFRYKLYLCSFNQALYARMNYVEVIMTVDNCINLGGEWRMQYLGNKLYSEKVAPDMSTGEVFSSAVPGYWEDMLDEFRKTKLHTKLEYNPLYTLQRYPQVGYVPDMALPTVIGCFGYSRTFSLTEGEAALPCLLYCGGAHNTLDAWINGAYIGKHKGYSSEFYFTIPSGVLSEGENEIILTVSNLRQEGYMDRPVSGCTARAANECTGGIYGEVELRFIPDGLVGAYVRCDQSLDCFKVVLEGDVRGSAIVDILDGKTVVASAEVDEGCSEAIFERGNLELWSPDSPRLYVARVRTATQEVSVRFGIRSLESRGIRLYLNGKPFYFRGICEHGYYPITVHPSRDKNYYRMVIKTMKNLGFNAIRFHTWVPMAEYMEAADELGVVIEVETPNNTTYEEWCDIVSYCKHYTSPLAYSSGNEMVIDEEYIEHLRKCAALVHGTSDALFSPMSAMRGIEYVLSGDIVDLPFPHNPGRIEAIEEFCDLFNTYSRGGTSYRSDGGVPAYLDECNKVYHKPLLSHEICIQGTYIDLSLEDRYRTSRIGDTELFSSVRRHLLDKGLLDRAPVYYKNSAAWQQILRKHCFEVCRRTESFSGYDYLGDIDHHWHTFGYCVGMMNEFYELKIGETVENVKRYNNDAVLLADLPRCVNFKSGERVCFPILVSNYGERLERATLTLRVTDGKKVYVRREIRLSDIASGELTKLYELSFSMPKVEKPLALKLIATLSGGNTDIDNTWDIYVFPSVKAAIPSKKAQNAANIVIADDMSGDELVSHMKNGKRVLLFSAGPLARLKNSFQISIAGRTEGHLATVINESPIMEAFPHTGFCSWQFREMLTDSHTALLDLPKADFKPIIESASSYKNARREAILFEYKIGEGSLLISTLNFKESDPAAMWLKSRIIDYAMGEEFAPKERLSIGELITLIEAERVTVGENSNAAQNQNDITMRVVNKR